MNHNVFVPIAFMFLICHVRSTDGSCAQNTYRVLNIQDVIAVNRPYIVSDASNWNAAQQSFDSTCGGQVCAGGTGFLDKSNDLQTIALMPKLPDGPKLLTKPDLGSFANVPLVSYVSSGGINNKGYVPFSTSEFLYVPIYRFLKIRSKGFTVVITYRYTTKRAWQSTFRFDGKNSAGGQVQMRIGMGGLIGNFQNYILTCTKTFGYTTDIGVWTTVYLRYNPLTNSMTTWKQGGPVQTQVCDANSMVDTNFDFARIGNEIDVAGFFAVDAFLSDAEVTKVRNSQIAGEDMLESGYPRMVTTSGTLSGNGATNPVAFVGGGVNVKMQWGALSVPLLFTICSVTRYSGVSMTMILGSLGNPLGPLNFIHGHTNGIAGATQYGDTGDNSNLNPVSISPNTNWVVVCGRNTITANTGSVIVNGIVRANARVPGGSSCALGINQHESFQSDWQLSKLYIWNYHLSDEHFALASLSLNDDLTGLVVPGGCIACPPNSCSPADSIDITACQCNAGYTGPNGGTCSQCLAGTYKVGLGPASCTVCPAGKYKE